jgi:hypothetical protein
MQGREEDFPYERRKTMRTALAGFLVALAYFALIGTFIGRAMPSQEHMQAYIDALTVSAVSVDATDTPRVG